MASEDAHASDARPPGSVPGPLALSLFCFARRSETCEFDESLGVEILSFDDDIAAVVSCVSLSDYCGPEAESRMHDLEWLAPRACHHEAVIEEVMRASPVLPVRFGSIFSSPERLAEFVSKHRAAISRFLDSIEGMEEWVIKAVADRIRETERILSETASRGNGKTHLSPGMLYFQQQRVRAGAEREAHRRHRELCARVVQELDREASQSCQRKILPHAAQRRGGEVILHRAFLVFQDRVSAFREKVSDANAEFRDHGLEFEASGPWPPYSFCPSLEPEP